MIKDQLFLRGIDGLGFLSRFLVSVPSSSGWQ